MSAQPSWRPWRVGLSAHLTGGGSVHTRTFEAALHRGLLRPGAHGPLVELHCACDGAAAGPAEAVAQRFVAAQVDVVVGHFASAAAARAAPVYARAGIPLLLPAATAAPLTRHTNVFRLCPSDDTIRAVVLAHLRTQCAWRRLCVQTDGGSSSQAFAQEIRAAVTDAAGLQLVDAPEQAEALFFVGRLHAAVQKLHALSNALPHHLLLSDDAIHPDMANALAARGRCALAFGLDNQPGELTYFAETCAALEIALALPQRLQPGEGCCAALRRLAWPTALGPVRFSGGENPAARVATWQLGSRGVHRLLPGPAVSM